MMRLHVEQARCVGHGRCYTLLPDLFIADDGGYSQTVNDGAITADQQDDAQRAVACCPEQAISVEDD